jgi:ATP-binding cassette subfamily B protein
MLPSQKNRNPMKFVLAFLLRHWRREAWLVAGVASAMIVATVADLFMPVFAGRIVDAIASQQAPHRQGLQAALGALGAMLALGAVLIAARHLAFLGIIRLTLRLMSRFASDAFWRVQRFSTDWQANNFAGSIVRRVTRGMWATDLMNDTLLLALVASIAGAGRQFAPARVGSGRSHGRHRISGAALYVACRSHCRCGSSRPPPGCRTLKTL